MDCDDALFLVAATRTLTSPEESLLHDHLDGCEGCRQVYEERQDEARDWQWLVRIPGDALDDRTLDLPTVSSVVFDRWTELASGGMGRILRAFDRRLGRTVAVKEVLMPGLQARFEREVRITARLQHPAIVPIYEAGQFPGGTSFYTMRLIPGRTLQDAIDEAPTLAARLRLLPHVRALTDAVAYAHAQGVIHRDLKPGNVLVGEFGETVVIDWGLAKLTADGDTEVADAIGDEPPESRRLTRFGSVLGTPCFMSPDQAHGVPSDFTDDVYAIGAILYSVLSGGAPYLDQITDGDPDKLIEATRAGPPTPLVERAPDAHPDLIAIAERAMSRARGDRFATAKELEDELARFEAGQLVKSRRYTSRELFVRWLRRHWRAVTATATGLVALVLVAILWLGYRRAERELAIKNRGAQLTALYGEVARNAFQIDRDLLHMETELEGLATAASWALTGPEPAIPEEIFFDTDFAAGRTPDDLVDGTAYRWPVSVEYPVVTVAPGVWRAPLIPEIERISPLRHHIRQMVLDAARTASTAPANDRLRARDSLIDYAYIGLPDGVFMVWPGMAKLRADYDARRSSFYENSKEQRGRRWGKPYVDATTDTKGDDLVLPCTTSVWSREGEFLGVAGVEMTVTKMVNTSMRMPMRHTLRTSLVDGDGKKVIDSSDAGRTFESEGRDEAIQLPAFDLPTIAQEIREHHEGIRELIRDGRPILVSFVRLDTVGWYYVVEVDAASLGAR